MGCCGDEEYHSSVNNRVSALESDYNKNEREPLRYDPKFNGPLSRRSCTDVICLLFFIIFLACWGVVAYIAFNAGNLNRLLVPTDSNGLRCGVDSEVLNKPFLVFFDLSKCADPRVPLTGCQTPQVCRERCPSESFVFDPATCNAVTFAQIKSKLICDKSVNVDIDVTSCTNVQRFIQEERCARWYLNSTPFLNRCISDLLPTECPLIKTRRDRVRFTRDADRPIGFLWPEEPAAQTNRVPVKEAEVQKKCAENRILGRQIILDKVQKTDTFLGRAFANLFAHFSNNTREDHFGELVVEDIIDSWKIIVVFLIIAMLCCLIVIAVMRWIAKPIVYLSIIGVLVLLGYGCYYCFMKYDHLKKNPVERTMPATNLIALFEQYLAKSETWLYLLIFLSVLLFILLLVLIVMRKRIVIAVALVKEGSRAVSSIYSTVFFPIFPWAFQVLALGFGIVVALQLFSVGDSVYKVSGLDNSTTCQCDGRVYANGDPCIPEEFNRICRTSLSTHFRPARLPCPQAACHFIEILNPPWVTWLQLFNLVGFVWMICFISAFGEMVLASTFATWYWTFKKADVPYFTLTKGLSRTVRYHLGTVAFGSLIITICRLIRILLEYVDQKCKKFNNEVTRAILCIFKCLFWLLEKFLRFLNKNAYIMCAIHGKNFCGSARDAFNLLMRNFLRVIALDQVTDFLFFLSKLLIALGMGACIFTYLESPYNHVDLHNNVVPAILVALGTYLIASVFFQVYSMAVDTLFLCFLEDCERNDGSPEKPYFMSKQLMRILKKHNKGTPPA